jgi:pentatricopeptide repeat protein
MRLLDRMQACGIPPNIVCYNAAISSCEKAGNSEQAVALLDELARRGLAPDVVSFSSAISACEKAGDWPKALELLGAMQEQGVAPNVFAFGSAISACGSGGRWQEALALLDAMRARGVAPNVVCFNAALTACERGGQPAEARRLLSRMEAQGVAPDSISFGATIAALDRAAEVDEMVQVMYEARRRGFFSRAWPQGDGKAAGSRVDKTKVVGGFAMAEDEDGVLAASGISAGAVADVDLRECSAAVSRAILRCILNDLRLGDRSNDHDIRINTGGVGVGVKGHQNGGGVSSSGQSGSGKGPLLPHELGAFLLASYGLEAYHYGREFRALSDEAIRFGRKFRSFVEQQQQQELDSKEASAGLVVEMGSISKWLSGTAPLNKKSR